MTNSAHPRGWIIDVDGCLVRTKSGGGLGGVPIDGAIEFLRDIQENGTPYVVCTNASEKHVDFYRTELEKIGFVIPKGNFATAGSVAVQYLAETYGDRPIIAIGSGAFLTMLREAGVQLAPQEEWRTAAAIVVGAAQDYGIKWINAGTLAAEAGIPLYSCVTDLWFHGGISKSVASSAIIAAAIGLAANVKPTILGKPSPHLGDVLANQMGLPPNKIGVIGDSAAEVDLAHAMGGKSYVVLSGALSESDVAAISPDRTPAAVYTDIGQMRHDFFLTK